MAGSADNPYLHRWYVLPRNPLCNVYLHKFLRDDDDRALHDHPWSSLSLLLCGKYTEELPGGVRRTRNRWSWTFRRATHAHRVELPRDSNGKPVPAWTLFLTGPVVRTWGFHCPGGWVHWKDFVDQTDTGNIGRGCGEKG